MGWFVIVSVTETVFCGVSLTINGHLNVGMYFYVPSSVVITSTTVSIPVFGSAVTVSIDVTTGRVSVNRTSVVSVIVMGGRVSVTC